MNQPQAYVLVNQFQRLSTKKILNTYKKFLKWKSGDEKILDIGSASGDVTMDILKPLLPGNMSKLVGIDISKEMVEFARSQNKEPLQEFVQMDITIKNLPHNFVEQFDHIFSFYCLHLVEDQRKAYENISRLLKPGGQTLLTLIANSSWYHPYETLSVNSKWKKYFENGKNYEPPYQKLDGQEHNIKHLLTDVGLTVHVCETVKEDYSFPDLNYYRQFAHAILPTGLKIPDSMRQEFIEDQLRVVRNLKYIKLNSDNQETPWIYVNTLVIVASK